MKIGIIGAGQIGDTLTRRLTALGHHVRMANSRHPRTLTALSDETGATAVWATDAAEDADLVILSIPQKNVPDLASRIATNRKFGAPVVETNNYYPRERDGLIAAIEAGMPESLWVAEQIGTPVIKAFNTIWYRHLLKSGLPSGVAGRIALPVAGADGNGKQLVFELIDELGFDSVDGGTLEESWRQQPGTPVYDKNLDRSATIRALAEASSLRQPEFRA